MVNSPGALRAAWRGTFLLLCFFCREMQYREIRQSTSSVMRPSPFGKFDLHVWRRSVTFSDDPNSLLPVDDDANT